MPKKFELTPQMQRAYERLKKVRASTTVTLKPCNILREEIQGLDGELEPFILRYYQVQGTYHMMLLKRLVLGDDCGLGKCVTGDTLVLTDRGLVPICQLGPDKEMEPDTFHEPRAPVRVWTGSGWASVNRFYWNGVAETLRVTTRNGYVVEGSLQHPLKVKDTETGEESFVKLPDLDPDRHWVCVSRNDHFSDSEPSIPTHSHFALNTRAYTWPPFLTPDLARLLGYVVGEVWVGSRYATLVLAAIGPNPESHKDIQQLLLEVYGWDGDQGSIVRSAYIRAHLQACGVTFAVSAEKEVPWVVLQGSRESVREFLRGLFEGGGSVCKDGGVEISSVSERLLRQVHLLLLGFGVVSSLSSKRVPGRTHTYWRLSFFGDAARIFQKGVGFVSDRKRTRLNEVLDRELPVQDPLSRHLFYDPIATIEKGEAPLMDIEVDDPSHSFVGNGMVNHNTVETIAALSYLWNTEKEAANKVIVVAPKSALHQWASEIRRFTHDVTPLVTSSKIKKGISAVEAREAVYKEWAEAPADQRVVLILNYNLLVRDWYHGSFKPPGKDGKPDPKAPVSPGLLDKITRVVSSNRLVVIFDECTAFKSRKTKTWEVCYFLSQRAHRVYGLTATLLKNRLFEGYCIFGVIRPGLFTTQKAFHEDYCFVDLKKVGRARVPIIKGYKNLDEFRDRIDPFFLGRKKHMVAKELPTLMTREVPCELSLAEDLKYKEALSGVLELGDGEIRVYEEHKALVSLIYCQQVVDSLAMLRFRDGDAVGDYSSDFDFSPKSHKVGPLGTKEQALVDLTMGELEDEKVIVYTRFASLTGRLQAILKKEGVKSTRITGKENDKARRANQEAFQDPKSDVKVIFITDAGSEAINLQVAVGMIFYDAPWSWGDYLQILGRMIRIGSPHKGVLAFHLLAERPSTEKADRKTIDHHVLSLLRRKRGFIDKVLGEGAVGALKFDKSGMNLRSLVRAMQGHLDDGV